MAQRLRVFAALSEDLSSIPSTTSGGSQLPVGPVQGELHSGLNGCLHMGEVHTEKQTHTNK